MATGKVLFFVLAVFVSMAWSEQLITDKEFHDIIMGCHKIYPIDENEMKDLTSDIHKEDADRLQKCFVKCFMESTKMMDQDGKFDIQRTYDITMARHKDQLKKDPMNAIKECTKDNGETNICSKAFASVKCVGDKKLW